MKKSFLPAAPILALFFLLTRPALSAAGARDGLLLWWSIVLPTLLPFMLCSSLLVSWGGVPLLVRPVRPFLSVFGLSPEGCYALISGLLCGYPMGAKTTADFLRSRSITLQEGKLLLAIAGCPSPMFLAGYIRPRLAPEIPFWKALLALYLPLLIIAFLASFLYRPGRSAKKEVKEASAVSPMPFDEILMNALEIMVKIGSYLMIYSILAAFITASDRIPPHIKPLLSGFLEMTTGIEAISRAMAGIPGSAAIFPPAAVFASPAVTASAAILACAAFGGLSGVSQTNTVIKNAGLPIRHYVLWKLLHAALTAAVLILLSHPR